MKTQNGFTLLEKVSEIGTYLKKQKVTRKITRLQVHMMDLPNYSTFEKTDKKVFDEPHFGRTESLNDYGKNKWESSDGHGKYIAQHFNVFPDGKITTGRHLNSTPIGIKGWNTNAICVEIYGDFDKGVDVMNAAQQEAVIALYGELCKRFDITPSSSTIRCHCWFTAGGNYLGGYYPSKAAKSCPGTGFTQGFGGLVNGYGNSKDAMEKYFYPKVKAYMKEEKEFKSYYVKVICDSLNGRARAGTSYDVVQKLKKDEVVTILEEKTLSSGAKWGRTKYYWINIGSKYVKFVRYV